MREIGDIRRDASGRFEYLRSQRVDLKTGYTEVWEPAAEHAARNLHLPPRFLENLVDHGYTGRGSSLYEFLIDQGWRPPDDENYIEIVDVAGRFVEGHRIIPELEP